MNVYFVSIGHRPFAQYVAQSFKEHLPDARVLQFSDFRNPRVIGIDGRILRPLPDQKKNLMLYMIESFAGIQDLEFITTGDDCILSGPLDDALEGDYDVALVKREKPRIDDTGFNVTAAYPYTNGLVIVRNKQFYGDCLDVLRTMPDLWDWFGDMACIRDVIDSGNYKVKLLSEDRYCKIPTKMGESDAEAVLWHYPGKIRKEWMQYHGKGENLEAV